MDGVLADHSDDIVMFDVPPPNEVRGKDAYRDTWPPFLSGRDRVPHSRSFRSHFMLSRTAQGRVSSTR
jgi:ketosteroid isomerase-like protein